MTEQTSKNAVWKSVPITLMRDAYSSEAFDDGYLRESILAEEITVGIGLPLSWWPYVIAALTLAQKNIRHDSVAALSSLEITNMCVDLYGIEQFQQHLAKALLDI